MTDMLIGPGADAGAVRRDAPVTAVRQAPVLWWAGLGAVLVAFMSYIGIKWVTGPFFASVPTGASEPPTWMKATIITIDGISLAATFGFIYWMIVRPWIKERRVTTDGMLLIAFFSMWFQDPMGNYGGYWFVYNSWNPNMGSWANELPGWLAYGEPGSMFAESFINGPLYLYFMMGGVLVGLWTLRKTKARYPKLGLPFALLVTYLAMTAFDLIVEVGFWQAMGLYTYTSSPGPFLFAGTFMQFPIFEAIMVGFMVLAMVCLRYFTDDKGHTFVERGIDRVNTTPGKKIGLRLLALIAGVQVLYFFSFTLPTSYWGAHSEDWPEQVQNLSYFTDGICGAGTTRLCPSESLPINRGNKSGWIGPGGKFLTREEAKKTAPIPFKPVIEPYFLQGWRDGR